MNTRHLRAHDAHDAPVTPSASSDVEHRPTVSTLQFETLTSRTAAQDAAPVASLHPLRHVKAQVQVIVGGAEVSVGELLDAKASHVVTLDRALTQPVDLVVEGQVIARGQLVAVDDKFAVRITELPSSLAL